MVIMSTIDSTASRVNPIDSCQRLLSIQIARQISTADFAVLRV